MSLGAPVNVPFSLVTAFASSTFGGNPAGVIFIDTNLPLEYLGKIAKNMNQPMVAFVSPSYLPSVNDKIMVRNIRFIAANGEPMPICGHGTLAAAKVIFSSPEVATSLINVIHFKNAHGQTLVATKFEDGTIGIQLPSTAPGSVSQEDRLRLKTFVDKAFGRDVSIVDIKNGGDVYRPYVMVELDHTEDLAGSSVNARELLGTGFVVHIFTTISPTKDEVFVSRMFSPLMVPEPHEDHVCGSAHGILVPYWSSKLGLNAGGEIKAKMVSARGGDLRLVFDEENHLVKLRGDALVFASGMLHL